MKPHRIRCTSARPLAMIVCAALSSVCVVAPATAQSALLATDSSEYVAGDIVTITGSGFVPNEALTLQIIHGDGGAEGGMGHEMAPTLADADGGFVATWAIAPADTGSNDFVAQVMRSTSGPVVAAFTRVARISTDKADYQPGETVVISGAAFAPGESVTLQIVHLTGAEDGGEGHDAFPAAADGGGNITSSWYVNPDDSRGSTFQLTAVGNESGRTASTTFTDAVGTPPDSTADVVYGQHNNFDTRAAFNAPWGISADSLWSPGGVATDRLGKLYVADTSNNRVLFYGNGDTTATLVYGQGLPPNNFTSGVGDLGGRPGPNNLLGPEAVTLDADGNVYIADRNNNRVLFYPAGLTTPTRVYGQNGRFDTANFNGDGLHPNENTLFAPFSVALDSASNLYIADAGNHRVLFYQAGSTTATRVYGQGGSFTTVTVNTGGRSANSLFAPWGVAVDSEDNLYVADRSNNRVLFFKQGETSASRVYGQNGNFTTSTPATTATALSTPQGVALDRHDNLYVADAGNNRVLFYPANSTTATKVYGQSGSFTTNTANNGGVGANSLDGPKSVALDPSGNLFVVDHDNNRVLEFYRAPDMIAPTASPTPSPAPNGNGWNNTDVTIAWNWTDDEDGLGIDATDCTMTSTSSAEADPLTLDATCSDQAGNMGTASYAVRIDKTPPTVSLVGGPADGGSYVSGSVPAAPTCSATDSLSGIAGTCTVSGYDTGVGSHTMSASAADVAGNQATVSASYTVTAPASTVRGFYAPVDMGGVWNALKNGATVPLKFEVFSGSTEQIDPASIRPLTATETLCTGGQADDIELLATGGTSLRYDPTSGQFIYNWQTPRKVGYCYVITVTTTDGATLSANFSLK
jgi:NHL repeat